MVWLTGAVTARSDFRTALLAVALFSLVVLLPAAYFLVRDRETVRVETAPAEPHAGRASIESASQPFADPPAADAAAPAAD